MLLGSHGLLYGHTNPVYGVNNLSTALLKFSHRFHYFWAHFHSVKSVDLLKFGTRGLNFSDTEHLCIIFRFRHG